MNNNIVGNINFSCGGIQHSLDVYYYDVFDINDELYQTINIAMSIDHPKFIKIDVPEGIDITNMTKQPLYIHDHSGYSLQLTKSCNWDSYKIGYVYISDSATNEEINKFIEHNNNIFNGNVYMIQSNDYMYYNVFNDGSQTIDDFIKNSFDGIYHNAENVEFVYR